MPHALIVDTDVDTVTFLSRVLRTRGFTTRSARSLAEARASLDPQPDCCIVDLQLPDGEGTALLYEGWGERSNVILLADYRSTAAELANLPGGAREFLTKPVSRSRLDKVLSRMFATFVAKADHLPELIGESPEMHRLAHTISRVGPADITVLIIGESGTGKELIASRVHALSKRAKGPYLTLNCGAVSPNLIESELFGHEKGSFTGASRQHCGYFERADGGTLFLDEITEMPIELQVRLLRVLENREVARVGSSETVAVDVRVIAATNRDPHEAVRRGRLREDLLYRLQVVPIEVPPLRQRQGDVRLLAEHFLAQLNQGCAVPKAFSEAALARLESYAWPGNVRELHNHVQRAFVLSEGKIITHPHVLTEARQDASIDANDIRIGMDESLAEIEKRVILHRVRNCRTQEDAARLLGVSTKTLYNKLRLYEAGAIHRSRTDSRLLTPIRHSDDSRRDSQTPAPTPP